ncbi:hypothetical protein [Flavobacterium sp.]|uniref:hypothetical protein n=1 Tax=Flavobacterium sp. TaxID=239 RepID=UPI003D27E44A
MSRIITDNYINKLNDLIEKLESSQIFCSLLDFFIDEVKKDQNRKGNRNQKVFSVKDLEKLNEIKKCDELNRIFDYINIIIKAFSGQYLHIHINANLSDYFLDNLTSLFAWKTLVGCSYDEDFLDNEINFLKKVTKSDLLMPSDNNGHATNQIFRKRHGLKHKLKFIEKIKSINSNNQKNGLLLNFNSSAGKCVNLSDFSIFPKSLNTYVNFGNSLQNIYDIDDFILQNIGTIISLFPAERGKKVWYSDFISENINAWNQLPGINFTKVITITSGEKTPEALLEMYKQNKFQSEEIYTVFSFEL